MAGPFRHIFLGTRAALRRPGMVVLYGGLDVLLTLTTLAPVILALALFMRVVVRVAPVALFTFDPGLIGDALAMRAGSPSFLIPVLGLAFSGALLSGVLRVFFLSGAVGVLRADILDRARPGTFMDNALNRFPAGLGAALLIVLAAIVWAAWTGGLLWGGLMLYTQGLEGGGLAAAGGVGALSFAFASLIISAALFDILLRLVLVKVLLGEEGPAVAFFEAVSLAKRRLGAVLVIAVVFIAAQLLVVIALAAATAPVGFLAAQPEALGFTVAARTVVWLARTLAVALVVLAAYGAFTALVMDEEGVLPAPEPPPWRGRPVPEGQPVAIARPVGPVARALPVVPAGPAEQPR